MVLVLIVQVLLLPGGRGNGAVGVHDDFGTADDHRHQQQTEEGDACQGQTLIHVHKSRVWCCLLHRVGLSASVQASATILITYLREIERQVKVQKTKLVYIKDFRLSTP